MRGKVATAAAVVVSLGSVFMFAAGCGGGDSTIQSISTTATTTSTVIATDEFITSADARCAEANAAIANLSTDSAASSSTVDQQLQITKQVLSGLKALGAPEDPDGSLNGFYAALADQVSALKQQQAALASGDTATYDSLTTQLDQAQTDAETAAKAFGFQECGQPGTALPAGATTTAPPASGTPAPTSTVAPVTPAPVTPVTPPATGGGGTGTGAPTGGTSGGSGSSGGLSPNG